jgi:hypothetical protein
MVAAEHELGYHHLGAARHECLLVGEPLPEVARAWIVRKHQVGLECISLVSLPLPMESSGSTPPGLLAVLGKQVLVRRTLRKT